jgi:hypothetical protein
MNRSGPHPAYSRECPQWQHQAEITQVKFIKGVTFREADEIVRRRSVASAGSQSNNTYANVAAPLRTLRSAERSCLTDYTRRKLSAAPVLLESVVNVDASLGSHNISSQESIVVQTERAGASHIPQSSVTAAASANVSAQAASVASAKSTPPICPNPLNQRESPSKTNENRRVSSSGTLQKGPQPLVATTNVLGLSLRWTWMCRTIRTFSQRPSSKRPQRMYR